MLDHWTANAGLSFAGWRLSSPPGRVIAYLAQETDCSYPGCGWDEFSQSGKLLGCPVCHGKGRLLSFAPFAIQCRVVWGPSTLRYVMQTPGTELGDVALTIEKSDAGIIQSVMDSPRSYLMVDDRKVRPENFSPSVIPGIWEGYLVACNLTNNAG